MHPTSAPTSSPPALLAAALAAVLAGAGAARAQCDPFVLPGAGVPGVDGSVAAFVPWDPDGPGPLGTHVVVGGTFTALVDVAAHGLGLYEPVSGTWSRLADCNGSVAALAVLPNGDLVVGGDFTAIDGIAANDVARFDGIAWSPLGGGFDGPGARVAALAAMPNGDVIAAGGFATAGGVPAVGLARWNGTAWSGFGDLSVGGFADGFGTALQVLPNGDLVASGIFTLVAGVPASTIARFDGAAWSPLGAGLTSSGGGLGLAKRLALTSTGELIAFGGFAFAGGVAAPGVATWNGAWSGLGTPPWIAGYVDTGLVQANGDILVGSSQLHLPGNLSTSVMRWHAGAWTPLGFTALLDVDCLAELPNGRVLVGGGFSTVAGQPGRGLARWAGTQWTPVATGTDGAVNVVLPLADGRLFVGGAFSHIAGVPAQNAAIYDRAAWQPASLSGSQPIRFAVELPDRSIFVARSAGNLGALHRWWFGSWQFLATYTGTLRAMAPTGEGDVVFGGDLVVANQPLGNLILWDGTAFNPVLTGFDGTVSALCRLPDGRLAVGGSLYWPAGTFLGHLAAWDGSQWDTLAGGTSAAPSALAVAHDGALVAVGPFQMAGGVPAAGVARFDGFGWSALGAGIGGTAGDAATCIAVLPDGDLLVGGAFASAGGTPAQNLARWDGTAWRAVGAGADGPVRSIGVGANGRVALGGDFVRVDGTPTAFVARFAAPCAAGATAYGSAYCQQGGNVLTLTVARLPWTGGALATFASGMPNLALGLGVYGLAPAALPLASVLPQGLPVCFLSEQPEFATLLVPTSGVAASELPIPDAPALVGLAIYHQILSAELAVGGAILSLGGTGAVAVTIGALW